MNTDPGMVVAVRTGHYEIHLSVDGTEALAVYPWELGDDQPHWSSMVAALSGMGFTLVNGCGYVEVPATDDGLTGTLEWDEYLSASSMN